MPSCILSELTGTGKLLKIVENLNVLTQEVTNFPRLQANCSRISPKFKYVCSFLIHLTNKFRVWLWKYLEKVCYASFQTLIYYTKLSAQYDIDFIIQFIKSVLIQGSFLYFINPSSLKSLKLQF